MINCIHCNEPQSAAPVICPKCYEELTQTNKRLTAQLSDARNELCQRCGKYKMAHKGACDGCRWRKTT